MDYSNQAFERNSYKIVLTIAGAMLLGTLIGALISENTKVALICSNISGLTAALAIIINTAKKSR